MQNNPSLKSQLEDLGTLGLKKALRSKSVGSRIETLVESFKRERHKKDVVTFITKEFPCEYLTIQECIRKFGDTRFFSVGFDGEVIKHATDFYHSELSKRINGTKSELSRISTLYLRHEK